MEIERKMGTAEVTEKYSCSKCNFPYDPHRYGQCLICGCTKISVDRKIIVASVSGFSLIDVKVSDAGL